MSGKYAGGDILKIFAPALHIYALLLPTIRKLVGGELVRATDESKTPHLAMHVVFLVKAFKLYF
jgi:hypothetical protein